jgi:hypothetical protein
MIDARQEEIHTSSADVCGSAGFPGINTVALTHLRNSWGILRLPFLAKHPNLAAGNESYRPAESMGVETPKGGNSALRRAAR